MVVKQRTKRTLCGPSNTNPNTHVGCYPHNQTLQKSVVPNTPLGPAYPKIQTPLKAVKLPPWWGDGGDGEMRRLVWWGSRRDGDDGCGGDVVDLSDEREEYAMMMMGSSLELFFLAGAGGGTGFWW
ncbi:hypothetical protein Tco_0666901 [Tanacetum coccineum]